MEDTSLYSEKMLAYKAERDLYNKASIEYNERTFKLIHYRLLLLAQQHELKYIPLS
jgi:hypothetical protein